MSLSIRTGSPAGINYRNKGSGGGSVAIDVDTFQYNVVVGYHDGTNSQNVMANNGVTQDDNLGSDVTSVATRQIGNRGSSFLSLGGCVN